MKIKGSGQTLNTIQFSHKGVDLHFQATLEPSFVRNYSERQESSIIEFSDLTEISTMIEMLKRFENEIRFAHLGQWKEV